MLFQQAEAGNQMYPSYKVKLNAGGKVRVGANTSIQ